MRRLSSMMTMRSDLRPSQAQAAGQARHPLLPLQARQAGFSPPLGESLLSLVAAARWAVPLHLEPRQCRWQRRRL
jgi:hypothetical protein